MKKEDQKGVVIRIRISRKTLRRISAYLEENWGAPFILTFMVLLMTAAGYLAYGLEAVANTIAIYAYYLLIAGVILQIASYIKYRDEEEKRYLTALKQGLGHVS